MATNRHANDVTMVCNVQKNFYDPQVINGYPIECLTMGKFKQLWGNWRRQIDRVWAANFHTLSIHNQKLETAKLIVFATYNDEIIGYALACSVDSEDESVYSIEEVCCIEGVRGHGIGFNLVKTLLLQLQLDNAELAILTCDPKQKVSRDRLLTTFYRSVGFRIVDPATV